MFLESYEKKFQITVSDLKQLKFKDLQDTLTSNSKTFTSQFGFQKLSRAWKWETF